MFLLEDKPKIGSSTVLRKQLHSDAKDFFPFLNVFKLVPKIYSNERKKIIWAIKPQTSKKILGSLSLDTLNFCVVQKQKI